MAEKRVTLTKDGFTYSVPESDRVEINQAKARGFTVKPEPKQQAPKQEQPKGETK